MTLYQAATLMNAGGLLVLCFVCLKLIRAVNRLTKHLSPKSFDSSFPYPKK